MKNIFVGFILIFLDFNLNLGQSTIGLVPDFIGYLVMANGLVEMARESNLFIEIKPYATGMSIFTGVLYVMDFLGVSATFGVLSFLFALISTVISLTISFSIVMGVIDMERKNNKFLNGIALKSTWNILVVFNILAYIALLFSYGSIIVIIATFIVHILFLVDLNKSKNLYYDTIAKSF